MLYVVMEKGDTDLSQLIRDISKTKKISMSMIIYYWTEMLTAVRDIHEKGMLFIINGSYSLRNSLEIILCGIKMMDDVLYTV